MNYLFLLAVLAVSCIAAPTNERQENVSDSILLQRPSPISPDVISDPKPQDGKIIMSNDTNGMHVVEHPPETKYQKRDLENHEQTEKKDDNEKAIPFTIRPDKDNKESSSQKPFNSQEVQPIAPRDSLISENDATTKASINKRESEKESNQEHHQHEEEHHQHEDTHHDNEHQNNNKGHDDVEHHNNQDTIQETQRTKKYTKREVKEEEHDNVSKNENLNKDHKELGNNEHQPAHLQVPQTLPEYHVHLTKDDDNDRNTRETNKQTQDEHQQSHSTLEHPSHNNAENKPENHQGDDQKHSKTPAALSYQENSQQLTHHIASDNKRETEVKDSTGEKKEDDKKTALNQQNPIVPQDNQHQQHSGNHQVYHDHAEIVHGQNDNLYRDNSKLSHSQHVPLAQTHEHPSPSPIPLHDYVKLQSQNPVASTDHLKDSKTQDHPVAPSTLLNKRDALPSNTENQQNPNEHNEDAGKIQTAQQLQHNNEHKQDEHAVQSVPPQAPAQHFDHSSPLAQQPSYAQVVSRYAL